MTRTVKTLSVRGGAPLAGAVKVEGCKISAVTILVSALLTDEPVCLREAPGPLDIELLITALEALGAEVDRSDEHLTIRCRDVDPEARLPARVFDDIHGSFYLLPALLARCG